MRKYKGYIDNDKPVNGGKYNKDHIGHEVYNFLPHRGGYFGFVQSGKISIDRLGASSKADFAKDVLVVWISTKPSGGQYIVGWYENDTVYREYQIAPDHVMSERSLKDYYDYNIYAETVTLLNEDERSKSIEGMGQSNTWYGNPETDADVLRWIEQYKNKTDSVISVIETGLDDLEGKERETIIKARVNQNKFREKLIRKYKHCMLCQVNDPHFLVASHIKPWIESSATEKLDVDNGLILCPSHDKLFDYGYISFDDNGKIMISNLLSETNRIFLNVRHEMTIEITEGNREYIRYHRYNKFRNT